MLGRSLHYTKFLLLTRRGFNLFELTITLAFTALTLPALGYLFGASFREDSHNSAVAQAYFLGAGLMNEISKRRFRESGASPGNGVDSGEESDFDRRKFDDIDDYNIFKTKWQPIAPRDESGNPLTDYSQFREYAEVSNVANVGAGPAPRSLDAVGDGTTDFKLVKVRVTWDAGKREVVMYKIFALR